MSIHLKSFHVPAECSWPPVKMLLRATPRDSLYLSLLLEIEILIEKYTPTASLSGYPNVAILYFSFLASQR